MTAATVRRRYVILSALRWLPVGALIPVFVLLLQSRGLSLAEIGVVTAAQGLVMLVLELPTGGAADALGRRPVLLLAALFELAAMGLLLVAGSLPLLVLVFALEGVYRALQSGPLEAWYVDAAQLADPDADIEGGLAAAGTVTGIAVAVGSAVGGGLVALDPFPGALDALAVPVLFTLVFRLLDTAAIALLVTEVRRPRGLPALRAAAADVPRVVGSALTLIRRSRWLRALVAVEVLWGAGMVAFEGLLPPKLAEVAGGSTAAATLLGPVGAVAWLANAAGAALVPGATARFGAARTGAALRILQGATVVVMGLLSGVAGVVAAYLVTYLAHGAKNPVHQGLLHRAVGSEQRTTIASANSMAAGIGFVVGGVALGALADATAVSTAIVVGGVILAAAAPLYLVRRDGPGGRRAPIASADGDVIGTFDVPGSSIR